MLVAKVIYRIVRDQNLEVYYFAGEDERFPWLTSVSIHYDVTLGGSETMG